MKLVFVRHTSVAVPKGICYGNTDVPLASSFEEEATLVKEKLRPYAFDRVYCSPLSRCVRLADFCGFPDAIRDSRLKEMNFGDWEMKRYDDITDPKLQEWFDDYINVRPPGGESVIDQRKRLENFVAEIKEQQSGLTVGIFTHGGILINALVANTGKTYEEVYNDIQPYGSIVEIEL
ncbi:alpha-ribazole phosphatase [uncultured Duncaniella sp.]|jgi:alpha-ribazole phosphatase|uniref:alpha-ribazole phosphatase n=1 Tax=uncultured Duncaniella sp. TaxID=2768039 RepID=UPI0025AED415|nr:alpha-ribazole phosphatase [uncultured Duncaniella sp.]